MIEYAITNGKGTLLDYGVVEEGYVIPMGYLKGNVTLTRPCATDCQTGK